MSTIQSSLPSLAQSLLSLSAQTQSSTSGSSQSSSSPAPAADTLTLSSSDPTTLAEALAQTGQQNIFAALANPAEALTANQSAISLFSSQSATALQAQGAPSADAVLSLG